MNTNKDNTGQYRMQYLALDLETYLIEGKGHLPKPICLSWYTEDGSDVGVVGNNKKDHEKSELEYKLHDVFDATLNGDFKQIWHNGFSFDLPVLYKHFPSLRSKILMVIDKELVHDTLILEKLLKLSRDGEVEGKRGYFSLASLVRRYVGDDISSSKKGPDIWRLRYGELDGKDIKEYPKEAYTYALKDTEYLLKVFIEQRRTIKPYGPGSANTEGLQIKSGFALSLATHRGLTVDETQLSTLEDKIDEQLNPLKQRLLELGFAEVNKKGQYGKANKKFIEYLIDMYPEQIQRTAPTKRFPDGQVRIDDSALQEYPQDEVIDTRLKMSLLEKYKGTYIKNIQRSRGVFKEPYDILKNTGRTSSFVQTMPREGGIREVFKARSGTKLVTIDYNGIEISTVAQTDIDLGLGTSLADYLNSGDSPRDPHCLLASKWHEFRTGICVTPDEMQQLKEEGDEEAKISRNQAKAPNLSFRGGGGNDTIAKISKGVVDPEQVSILRAILYDLIPETQKYLGNNGWVGHQKKSSDIHKTFAYEFNGRYRNNCTYAACANGRAMQSPAADGAKEAIWLWFKQLEQWGDYLVLFVHDELGAEISDNEELRDKVKHLSKLMCEGMQKVVPDVRISVEGGIMDNWSKEDHEYQFRAWKEPTGEFCYEGKLRDIEITKG